MFGNPVFSVLCVHMMHIMRVAHVLSLYGGEVTYHLPEHYISVYPQVLHIPILIKRTNMSEYFLGGFFFMCMQPQKT